MSKRVVHLIDHTSWRRDELCSGENVTIHHNYGFSLPKLELGDGFWAPQEPAVHILESLKQQNLLTPHLSAPGVNLLPSTPTHYTGRQITALTVQQALTTPKSGWWKAAEAKIDIFESKWRSKEELLEDLKKLPASTVLHYSDICLNISKEYRIYMLEGLAVTSSIYLQKIGSLTKIVYDGLEASAEELFEVEQFANQVSKSLAYTPKTYVMDVALLRSGNYVVLEYNPTWCSAWYDCNIDNVVECLIAATVEDRGWRYQPDEFLLQKIHRPGINASDARCRSDMFSYQLARYLDAFHSIGDASLFVKLGLPQNSCMLWKNAL